MKWPRTLRLRFALWVAGLLLAVLAGFGAFVYISLARDLNASVDDSLRLNAAQVSAALRREDGKINFQDPLPESGGRSGPELTVQVFDLGGQLLQAGGEFPALPVRAASLAFARQGQSTFASLVDPQEHEPVRVYTLPLLENDQVVAILQVGQSLEAVQEALSRLRAALLLGGPVLVLVAAFGGYILATRTLAPMDHITRTAGRISAEDLSARLALPATDDEVGRLAATFDAMLARLEAAFLRERQFTADASHELRTPLAAMQAILSVIREQRRTPEDYEQALADLSEEADRLRSLVEGLLRLARSDSYSLVVREPVDVSTLLRDVGDSMRPLAEAKGLELTGDVADGLCLSGDGDALIRLFLNLLDNAVKYTDHGRVALCAAADPGRRSLTATIADTGIGIPPERLPHIFDRFYRAEAARSSPGYGLGLAIAREIVRAHDGTIDVVSTAGRGTTFTVRLPLSA